MTPEPTPGEVDRSLQQFRQDIREDFRELSRSVREGFAQMSARLDKVPSLDVYNADKLRAEEKNAELRERIKAIEEGREADAKSHAANRRWIIGAILVPVGVAILEVILLAGGKL